MKIRIDKADETFSRYIRLRDKMCVRCYSRVEYNDKGLPITHQASHYFGRGSENTRFDVHNVDTLCTGCHQLWGSRDKEGYRSFKVKQLGENGFKVLQVASVTFKKKDRRMEFIRAKILLDDLLKSGY